jgi:hypothetical protein
MELNLIGSLAVNQFVAFDFGFGLGGFVEFAETFGIEAEFVFAGVHRIRRVAEFFQQEPDGDAFFAGATGDDFSTFEVGEFLSAKAGFPDGVGDTFDGEFVIDRPNLVGEGVVDTDDLFANLHV